MNSSRKWSFVLLVLGFFVFPTSNAARLRHRAADYKNNALQKNLGILPNEESRLEGRRRLEIEEYPVQLEPFHLVYHHHPRRDNSFEGMEEMDVLAATRNYLSTVLHYNQGDNLQRLLLYLFIRQEDEFLTKVAYSGTAFLASPTTPAMRNNVQDLLWRSFLGTNKTDYLSELNRYDVLHIDGVTLLTVAGNLVGIDSNTGGLSALSSAAVGDGTSTDINNRTPPDTSMSSSVSKSLYISAIIIPLVVILLLIGFFVLRKLRYDVLWKPANETDPDGAHWQTSQKMFEQQHCFAVPEGITIVTPSSMTEEPWMNREDHTMQVYPLFIDDEKVRTHSSKEADHIVDNTHVKKTPQKQHKFSKSDRLAAKPKAPSPHQKSFSSKTEPMSITTNSSAVENINIKKVPQKRKSKSQTLAVPSKTQLPKHNQCMKKVARAQDVSYVGPPPMITATRRSTGAAPVADPPGNKLVKASTKVKKENPMCYDEAVKYASLATKGGKPFIKPSTKKTTIAYVTKMQPEKQAASKTILKKKQKSQDKEQGIENEKAKKTSSSKVNLQRASITAAEPPTPRKNKLASEMEIIKSTLNR